MDTIIIEVDPSQITPAFARNPAGGEYLPFFYYYVVNSFLVRVLRTKKEKLCGGAAFYSPSKFTLPFG
jgi:hypothetical protein